MSYDVLNDLFDKIGKVTQLTDIAYHEIRNGRLNPVHKTNTDVLGIDKWKKGHAENPVYIDKTLVLRQIINGAKYIHIDNTKEDKRSSEAFFFFGVDSILIVPVHDKSKAQIKGIVCIVSINKLHNFSDEQINKCLELVKNYEDLI
ncbi:MULTISPECIES: hypothetical protein [Clostridium]|uniref:hypothetical protein n=1 Tax=Clostridium TaxID=1485 RepID=UPI00069EF235|nr:MULTISPECIES: hypothetical protein [Clostridium]KOF56443.1 hypothetical protein AGR56_06525 [Clostridium sp. DMHC 10]MCD2347952.1 hypothetical protein [Clostridium guangxiense]